MKRAIRQAFNVSKKHQRELKAALSHIPDDSQDLIDAAKAEKDKRIAEAKAECARKREKKLAEQSA
jgi:hypothetical protein